MLRKSLIIFGGLAFSTFAVADDITNPFFLPKKMQLASVSSVGFDRSQQKNSASSLTAYNTLLQEELQFGLSDKLTLWGYFGNTFNKVKLSDGADFLSHQKDKNLNWGAGVSWNILDKTFKLQASFGYHQDDLYAFNGDYKFATAKIKGGYQLESMLPYIEIAEELPIGQKKDYDIDKPIYTAKVGLYQGELESWGLDTGLRVIHDENDNTESTFYNAEGELSYYLTPKATVGLYGSYTLSAKAKNQTDIYDKSIGLRFKWTF